MMDESAYLPRIADELLESKLKQTGAVVIRGPKWCGKTEPPLGIRRARFSCRTPISG